MMKFEIHGDEWNIYEKTQDEILKAYNGKADYIFGLTLFPKHEIWIDKEMHLDQKRATLLHELAHCWIWYSGSSYISSFNEETVCDIVACSYKFVHDTLTNYKWEEIKHEMVKNKKRKEKQASSASAGKEIV